MMDDEGRGARQRKKQADPTCCPVCGITVRGHEMEQHYSLEMERLNKLSTQKNRKSHSKDMASPVAATATAATTIATTSATSPTAASSSSDNKDCWNTYQRIKNNRSSRLKLKSRKRRADDPLCPICSERVSDDLDIHVELCLRRSERNNGSSNAANDDEDDINIDVEGEEYEEYEWAGQTRIRASSLLEGGYSATGLHTSTVSQKNDDEDEDLNVDGDDTQIYGKPIYSERDIILPMADNNKKETIYLRNLVIGESTSTKDQNQNEPGSHPTHEQNGIDSAKMFALDNGLVATTSNAFGNRSVIETEIECESTASSSKIQIDLKDGSVKEITTTKIQRPAIPIGQNDTASAHIIEALKEKIREYETIIRNKSKCLICMDEYRDPVVSICCWHVHCEVCWLRTLGARKLCPQCNMITSPADLRKIYM